MNMTKASLLENETKRRMLIFHNHKFLSWIIEGGIKVEILITKKKLKKDPSLKKAHIVIIMINLVT